MALVFRNPYIQSCRRRNAFREAVLGHQARLKPAISILASRILLHTSLCISYIVGSVIMFRFLIQLSWIQKTGWEGSGAQRQSFVFEPSLASVSAFWFFLDFAMPSCTAVLPSARDSYSQFQNTREQDQLRPIVTACQHTPDSRSLLVLDTSGTWEERTTTEKNTSLRPACGTFYN